MNKRCYVSLTLLVATMFAACGTDDRPVHPGQPPGVCHGDTSLTTQAEVDAFHCGEVTGSLSISGTDITNLWNSPRNTDTSGAIIEP
jgi:hypothetical protein